jgi:hypothetical protein
MSTYRSRIYKEIITIKTRFYQTSLISKATDIFYPCKRLFNYLGKLARQQGLSFVVGIAVGVNLLLLLQMSEDIVNKLSETSTSSIVGIIAILSTIAFGIAIIYMQRKTNGRINTLSSDHRTFIR